jgi:hypothetical protein
MKKMKFRGRQEAGSTLMVVIAVTASILVLLGVAVDYSSQISRSSQRSRKTALAMEIADGHLETLFTQWRNTYRTTWSTQFAYYTGATDLSICGTNFFYTDNFKPGVTPSGYTGTMPTPSPIPYMNPAATPPVIPLPDPSNFSNNIYTVSQYRIQAVDPMITLDSGENSMIEGGTSKQGASSNYSLLSPASTPPSAYGPNDFQYSFFYLAAVDVKVPALHGDVTAKVRRVFEKKFDQPWTYALFYVDDLELQPTTAFTVTGPVHTNANLYVGNSNFTAAGAVEYGGDYVNGYSPKDPRYPGSGFSTPNFAKSSASLTISDCPPAQVAPYLPFGWNLSLSTQAGNGNDDSYHEIIERSVTGVTDPLSNVRFYNQSGYQVVIETNGSYTVTSIPYGSSTNPSPTPTSVTGTALTKLVGNSGQGTSSTVFNQGRALYDAREGGAVKVTDVDIANLISNLSNFTNWTGVLYLADKGATTYNADGTVKSAGTASNVTINGTTYSTTKRAFRIVNATKVPQALGLTIVSENPVYIQGDFNTGGTPPSDSGTYTSPTVSGYTQTNQTTKPPVAVIADAITVLSAGWNDSASNSANGLAARVASANITLNAALVSGNVPSNGTKYSGGAENFIRLLENWTGKSFCYYGSLVQLYRSNQAVGTWNGDGATVYAPPTTNKFYYDDVTFSTAIPPGKLVIAAYLQQQRWYQVY